MATKGFDITSVKYKGYLRSNPWTLVVGAGICNGILPSWFELTRRIYNKCFKKNYDDLDFKDFVENSSFSLDSIIQASLNEFMNSGGNTASFSDILQQELYSDLMLKADGYGIKRIIIKLFYSTKSFTKDEVILVCNFFDKEYGSTTILKIAKTLIENADNIRLPNSIITFNADSKT